MRRWRRCPAHTQQIHLVPPAEAPACCHLVPPAVRNWLEEKARNRQLEEQLVDLALYEIEVKTGGMKVGVGQGASTPGANLIW